MNRKLKALGLALFAALALSVVGASAATAEGTDHITAAESWTPTVSAIDTQVFEATTGTKPKYECEKVSATVTEPVGTTVDEIAVTPDYDECEAENAEGTRVSAQVRTNECEYIFKSETTTGNPTGEEHANVEIRNHENTEADCLIEVRVTAFNFKCAAVPNQVVDHAVRYKQNGDHIDIEATAHGIENITVNSFACPTETGENETHADGSYAGKVTVEGTDAGSNPEPLSLQENAT